MNDNTSNNKRIAKNTLLLYLRMFFIMSTNLYISRVVLKALGEIDYGVYNVVGGIVVLFTFISSALSNSSLRFITFSIGKGDKEYAKQVFTVCRRIHLYLALGIIILIEIFGYWFLTHKMIIPPERIFAAKWVFHFSVISCGVAVISSPYNSLILAHEKMNAFAYISIVDILLKLIVACTITICPWDNLLYYAFCLLAIQVTDRIIYSVYCLKRFEETQKANHENRKLFKEMISFSCWSMIGNLSWMGYTQGLNLMLNTFFGPVVNAARAIAFQVQSALKNFVNSFQTAINPQITKSYAQTDFDRLNDLIIISSKYSFLLMLCMITPLYLELNNVLKLWLGDVPDNTLVFTKLVLCITLIEPLVTPIGIANNATGNIKKYQMIEGLLLILILPISYLFLNWGFEAYSVFIVQIIISIITQFVRVAIVKKKLRFSIKRYLIEAIFPIASILLIDIFACFCIQKYIDGILLCMALSELTILALSFLLGIGKKEKKYVINLIRNKI